MPTNVKKLEWDFNSFRLVTSGGSPDLGNVSAYTAHGGVDIPKMPQGTLRTGIPSAARTPLCC